ncbi:MAG: hypothetical protein JST01_21700 [Cyanobacteria bacterium SZAS TMP-1]|nr:hypothetical protein [Cyanobacteria bacterium SZAS TMP-1]
MSKCRLTSAPNKSATSSHGVLALAAGILTAQTLLLSVPPALAEEAKSTKPGSSSTTAKPPGATSGSPTIPTIPNIPVPGKPVAKIEPVDPTKDPKGALKQAIDAYKAGQFGQAAALLATDLQANPDDGQVHYYMGLALKKQGMDMKALNELEKAARLVPPEMIKKFADEQVGNLDLPEPAPLGAKPAPAASGDWLSNIGNSISGGIGQMFGAKPAPSTGTSTGGSGTTSTALNPMPAWPDFMAPINDAVKQGKRMLRKAQGKENAPEARGGGDGELYMRQSGEAMIMHMADIQAFVAKSHTMNIPGWGTDPGGVQAFYEAPENTPEWDYWIGRFKRCFQHQLMRHMNSEATGQVRGAASCIFSVDRAGNLKGQVFASTADPVLVKCLVESIKDLNHSRILKFPVTSHINGWNFKMSWNLGFYLAIVKAYQEQKERQATVDTLVKLVQQDTAIQMQMKKAKEERAIAKKLAAEKALKAKLRAKAKQVPPPIDAKAEVSGQIVGHASERELKAVALELKDLTPVTPESAQQIKEDPFATIDDQTINSWPDLNR